MSYTEVIDRAYAATRMTAEEERKAAMQNVCAVPGCDTTRNLYTCELHPESGEAALRCEMHSDAVMVNGHDRILCLECSKQHAQEARAALKKKRR